ncbi:MAG: phenylalanine--tRNA ligase subunit alpha [Candidatus Saccharicenans sp.]|nr:phenylalanine--tRNA ligase subunit alpha [Candidatus Saccharicenans sp.]MDH7494240.1 phenylalanine--tRNA ligase subunit alpha [Candidatus Saccharicenans sp.]
MSTLQEKINHYRQLFTDLVSRVKEAREVEELRQLFLGRKKGHLTLLFEEFKHLGPEEKKNAGRILNELKSEIQTRLAELEQKFQAPARVRLIEDPTLPGQQPYWGSPHPITLFQREIEKIFISMGFSVEEGPEIETDYYNFEALNFPPHHPARDSWDTLYINDKLLLRTHTSPVQIRVMEKKKPPIRIIIPGKVFRRETPDPTHLPMFYQVEGLVVDRGITFAHLKGTLEYFIKALFGEKIKLRFRPSFFPFTEPSAEVDIECIVCSGRDPGCRVCGGSGWKEILGAGLVDPQVFKNVNIDPEIFSGWAFGLGIDRTAMFAFQIPEIRYFYENDLRFLRQFNRR